MKTVIEMAREAGYTEGELAWHDEILERFAELVRADERARMAEQPAREPGRNHWEDGDVFERIGALAQQPAQQEPVAWVCYGAPGKRDIDFEEADINGLPIGTLLYTFPPQRTWVGLTNQERGNVIDNSLTPACVVLATEAKLKEKNTP